MASAGYSFDSTVAAVFVFALAVLVLLYYLHRLKKRRQSLPNEVNSRASVGDRAFNEMQLARQAAARLEREGVDVSTAKGLLARAEGLVARGDARGAFEAARAARDTLLLARSSGTPSAPARASGHLVGTTVGPASPARPPDPTPIPIPDLGPVPAAPGANPSNGLPATSEGPAPNGRPRLPKNQLEARFELALLEEEVERQRERPPDGQAWAEAQGCARDARRAYDGRDFTEALRLALRGRRRLGSRVETIGRPARTPVPDLPPSPAAERKPAPSNGGPSPASLGNTTPTVTCARCGRPGRAEDRFCRGCGASLAAAPCPACGAARLEASDRFCGVCGAPMG
jgi:hypothetical protein